MPNAILMPTPRQRFVDNVGLPLANGMVFTFAAGTSDKLAAYTDPAGLVPHKNPIRLDIRGEATIYWLGNYKIDVRTALGVQLPGYPVDNYNAVDANAAITGGLATFLTNLAANAGSALVGFIASGAGALKRTVQDKLRDTLDARDFGAKGDGTTDDTLALQRLLTAMGVNGVGRIPRGSYLLSATLNAPNGANLMGDGWAQTKFVRTGDYGDTIQFGTSTTAGGAARLSGIGMFHSTSYSTGDGALANKATQGAHVRLWGTQGAIIDNCWLFRLPYSIIVEGGSVGTIRDCAFQGTWDHTVLALQEGVAQLYMRPNATFGNPVTWTVENCKFNGCNTNARNVSLVSGDGTVTRSMTELIGNRFGVLIEGAEDFSLTACYLGGFNVHCMSYSASVAGAIIDNRILNNHFDGARIAQIAFDSQSAGKFALGVQIANNTLNGEAVAKSSILVVNSISSTLPSLVNFSIVGNTSFLTYGSGLVMSAAWGGTISGNTISSYNTLNAATTDSQWVAGIFSDTANCKNISISANIIGGGGTLFEQNAGNTYTYRDVVTGAACINVSSRNNVLAGIRNGSNFITGIAQTPNQYLAPTQANYAMFANEDIYIRNYAASAATVCVLPPYPATGREVTVKDGTGSAGAFAIVVQTSDGSLIDGAANLNISTNYGFYRLRFNSAQWNRIG